MVADGLGTAQVVEPDGIRTPLPALNVGKERCVGSHVNDVCVLLQVGHESSFIDAGSRVVVLLAAVMAGILAGKYLGTLAVIFVIAVHFVLEPVDVAVEMLIHKVCLQFLHGRPTQVEILALAVGAAGTDEFNLGMHLADGIHEDLQTLGESLVVLVVPLLIAHTQVLQVEGGGVSHFGTQGSPLVLGRVAVGKLDEVDAVIDVGLEVFDGHVNLLLVADVVLELTAHAHVQHGKRFCTNLLRQTEILVEAQSVTLEIVGVVTAGEGVVPAVLVQRTVLYRAYRVLPLVARGQVGTLHDASSGEAEHAGLHVEECLCQVLAHTVLISIVRIDGEEADVLQVSGHAAVTPYAQVGSLYGLAGLQHEGVFFPLLARYLNAAVAQFLVLSHGGIIYQVNPYLGVAAFGTACPNCESVCRPLLQSHAEESVVLNHGVLVVVSRGSQTYIMGILVEGAIVLQGDFAGDVPSGKGVGKLERSVYYQFGIQTAIGSVVDVLKEDAVHGRLHGGSQFGCFHRDGVVLG